VKFRFPSPGLRPRSRFISFFWPLLQTPSRCWSLRPRGVFLELSLAQGHFLPPCLFLLFPLVLWERRFFFFCPLYSSWFGSPHAFHATPGLFPFLLKPFLRRGDPFHRGFDDMRVVHPYKFLQNFPFSDPPCTSSN